jgi:hypothetical protein
MKNIFFISFLLLFAGGEVGKINLTAQISVYLHDFLVIGYLFLNFNNLKKIIKKLKNINKIDKKILFLLIFDVFLAFFMQLSKKQLIFNSFLYIDRAIAYFLFIVLLKIEF